MSAAQPAVVQAPEKPEEGAPPAPPALLVLLPGGLLGPADYDALLKALQEQSSGVGLWVAAPTIDWQHLVTVGFGNTEQWDAYGEGVIKAAVEAAVEAGFPLQGKPEARMDNVFVAMHSMAGAFCASYPMKHCGGAIMLGACLDATTCPAAPDAAAAPRPLMHILGALDGQLRLPRAAWLAASLAPLAAQYGARHFAHERPFAIIPGMNHAQFSNGVPNTARGDVTSDAPIETQTEAVAGLMAAFIAANHPAATADSAQHAAQQLVQATAASFDLLSPYCEAAGRGSPAALLAATAPPADAASHGYGAERLGLSDPAKSSRVHPGELAAAERFCREAQLRMLAAAGLPAGAGVTAGARMAAEPVRVAVTAHTVLETFIYSQPVVFQTELPTGKEWVVHCHVYLHTEYYQPGAQSMLQPMSHQYYMKLKKGSVLAMAMGAEGCTDAVVTAAEVNEETYQQALAAAPQLFVDTHRQRGKQLQFAPDRDITAEIKSPIDWMATPISFEAVPGIDNTLSLTAPCVSTDAAQLPAYDRGPGRFRGNHYIKCCSPAWMHEWIMIESLRR